MKIEDILNAEFLADDINDNVLDSIGEKVCEWFDEDVRSRADWEHKYNQWIKLASQTMEAKNTPWQGAANIKFPMLSQAAINFNARMMPSLLPGNEPVSAAPVGPDPTGELAMEATKVSKHMNYQLTQEIEEWEEDFDKLSLIVSITGQEYKKTYYSYEHGRTVSKFVSSADLVLHYWYDEFEYARKTEKMYLNWNRLLERMNMGIYKAYDEKDIGEPRYNRGQQFEELRINSDERHGIDPSKTDEGTTHLIIEHHGWYDLDDDGYAEPYRIVVHYDSKKVLVMQPRFTPEMVEQEEDGSVIRIQPIEYYTKFGMIPNPDGSNYDVGFGTLVAPLNHSANTAINQLLDAGTLANMQPGFIGKGIRMRNGAFKVQPGKWPIVNVSGGALRDNVFPMPVREPSAVIYNLMMFMVGAGKELTNTTAIFSGEHPGQNAKTGVTEIVREEGLKMFNAIYKRFRRSLKRELHKIYHINSLVLQGNVESKIVRSAGIFQVGAQHYDMNNTFIEPSADPKHALKSQRIQEAMGVMQVIAQYGGNIAEARRRLLIAMEVDNIEPLLQEPEPQPDPQTQLEQAKLQMEMAEIERKANRDDDEAEAKKIDQAIEIMKVESKTTTDNDKNLTQLVANVTNAMRKNAESSNSEQGGVSGLASE